MGEGKEVVERCWICNQTEQEIRNDSPMYNITFHEKCHGGDKEKLKELFLERCTPDGSRASDKHETLHFIPPLTICIRCEAILLSLGISGIREKMIEGDIWDRITKMIVIPIIEQK